MKRIYVLLLLLCCFCKENIAQSLIWMPVYTAEPKRTGLHTSYYREFKLRFRYEDSYLTILPKRANRSLLRVTRQSSIEVFNNRYLVISIPTPTKYGNGMPNIMKDRDTLYFIDIKKRKVPKIIFWVNLQGKKLLSNAIELTILNKSHDYNYALKEVSFAEKKITLLSFDSLKMVTMPLQRL